MKENFEERYRNGNTPWDHGLPDRNLTGVIESIPIVPCKVLDIGCGTGDNVIWLAQHGFMAAGCDLSSTAIKKAEEKAAAVGVECTFTVCDFLKDKVDGVPVNLVIDRGCLHTIDKTKDRRRFAQYVAASLEEGGHWIVMTGNADEPPREVGPPQLTAAELTAIVESCFEILSLTSTTFDSDMEEPPMAWLCLLRKRAS